MWIYKLLFCFFLTQCKFMPISNWAQKTYFFMAFFILKYGGWLSLVKINRKYFLSELVIFALNSTAYPWRIYHGYAVDLVLPLNPRHTRGEIPFLRIFRGAQLIVTSSLMEADGLEAFSSFTTLTSIICKLTE